MSDFALSIRGLRKAYASGTEALKAVDLDIKQAAMWRALARRQGLSDPQLDKLLAGISQADLNSAEELARFWPSKPPTAEDVAAEQAKMRETAKSVPSEKLVGAPG